jgi:hypothetical protein
MQRLVTTYLVCGNGRPHYLFSVSGHRVVRCHDCHLLLTNPQPSDEELQERIEAEAGMVAPRREELRKDVYLEVSERYYGGQIGRLLQVGCSPDLTVDARGFNVSGTEKSATSCEAARTKLRGVAGPIGGHRLKPRTLLIPPCLETVSC